MTANRLDRFHKKDRDPDQCLAGARDRDRVLYCSALRRLAEVTQVVSPDEGHVFHNRLTHSLKVAQIARRLAEKLVNEQPQQATKLGLDPEIAEAAALAHDLGHPPFGHVAEEELNELANEAKDIDGFEGNAQSFRIITKLAVRHPDQPEGLNLTRATLNAVLKYPWFRTTSGKHQRKWGAYRSEEPEFKWAREPDISDERKSAEAELMDWADDIAYSVHDVEDFYRGGLIPLDRVLLDQQERDRFSHSAVVRLRSNGMSKSKAAEHAKAFGDLLEVLPARRLSDRFRGTTEQRAVLRSLTSFLVSRYIGGIKLRLPRNENQSRVTIEPDFQLEVTMLKQLVWHYVIENPALATQQHGQRQIIRGLFTQFMDAASGSDWSIFPIAHRERLNAAKRKGRLGRDRVRIVVDMISGLTERQTIRLHQRLSGTHIGSLLEPLT